MMGCLMVDTVAAARSRCDMNWLDYKHCRWSIRSVWDLHGWPCVNYCRSFFVYGTTGKSVSYMYAGCFTLISAAVATAQDQVWVDDCFGVDPMMASVQSIWWVWGCWLLVWCGGQIKISWEDWCGLCFVWLWITPWLIWLILKIIGLGNSCEYISRTCLTGRFEVKRPLHFHVHMANGAVSNMVGLLLGLGAWLGIVQGGFWGCAYAEVVLKNLIFMWGYGSRAHGGFMAYVVMHIQVENNGGMTIAPMTILGASWIF
ncbi:hypothetical protein R6Q59_031726 [Mikania micrantha]